jgi:hypothetical protein
MATNELTVSDPDADRYPTSRRGWALALMPEIAVFVFLAVMVFALIRNGGPYVYALWLLPVLVIVIWGCCRVRERAKSSCS